MFVLITILESMTALAMTLPSRRKRLFTLLTLAVLACRPNGDGNNPTLLNMYDTLSSSPTNRQHHAVRESDSESQSATGEPVHA